MEPDTTVTFGPSSLVPWPNELSEAPLARSSPRTRFGAFSQSLPLALTTRLPSDPSNELPGRFARAWLPIANVSIRAPTTLTCHRRNGFRRFMRCLPLSCLPRRPASRSELAHRLYRAPHLARNGQPVPVR